LPLYEYKCVKCGHRFEKIESVGASETKKCPKCGGKAERQLAAPAIQFKGSGWYVTDYAGKNSTTASGESGDAAASKGAEKSTDAKPAAEKGGKGSATDAKKK
jgi:putative FmdB family regulatory protein